jgi:hypothetical protein
MKIRSSVIQSVTRAGASRHRSGPFLCSIVCVAFSVAIWVALTESAWAQQDELLTVSTSGISKQNSPAEASREIQAQVMTGVAREQVIEMIGSARYEKNKRAIEAKIIRESARYIPFVKRSDPVQQADGSWKVSFELKVALASLRQMILEQGLLGDEVQGGGAVALVSFGDRRRLQTWRWWTQTVGVADSLLLETSRLTLRPIADELLKSGFLVLTPPDSAVGFSPLPAALRIDQPSSSDLRAIAEHTKTTAVLLGDVQLRESPTRPGATQIALGFVFHQVSSGRVIAEVTRQFETEPGVGDTTIRQRLLTEMPEVARDLSSQVQEANRRGTLASNLIQITLAPNPGPGLGQEVRSSLVSSVRDIRAIRERFIERDRLVFEVDFAGGDGQALAQRLRAAQQQGRAEWRVQTATSTNVQLEVRATR